MVGRKKIVDAILPTETLGVEISTPNGAVGSLVLWFYIRLTSHWFIFSLSLKNQSTIEGKDLVSCFLWKVLNRFNHVNNKQLRIQKSYHICEITFQEDKHKIFLDNLLKQNKILLNVLPFIVIIISIIK